MSHLFVSACRSDSCRDGMPYVSYRKVQSCLFSQTPTSIDHMHRSIGVSKYRSASRMTQSMTATGASTRRHSLGASQPTMSNTQIQGVFRQVFRNLEHQRDEQAYDIKLARQVYHLFDTSRTVKRVCIKYQSGSIQEFSMYFKPNLENVRMSSEKEAMYNKHVTKYYYVNHAHALETFPDKMLITNISDSNANVRKYRRAVSYSKQQINLHIANEAYNILSLPHNLIQTVHVKHKDGLISKVSLENPNEKSMYVYTIDTMDGVQQEPRVYIKRRISRADQPQLIQYMSMPGRSR